jgi:outer membrane immunogenic protein
MPAAQMNWNKIGLLLAVGTFSAVAIPALSGDWQSASFFAAQNNQVGASIQGFDQPRDSLEFSADRDYGRLVLGGSYSRGSGSLFSGLGGAAGTERVSLRAGYDFGQSLGYVSLGRQQALALRGEDATDTLGIGIRVSLNRALQLTGEYLHRAPSEPGAYQGQSPSRISIGAAFRF